VRNVSGYLTDDGRFFQDKKEAEAHERFLSVNTLIDEFVRDKYIKTDPVQDTLRSWEKYKQDAMK
jgi:dsDNA-binding SOS-regulon protein